MLEIWSGQEVACPQIHGVWWMVLSLVLCLLRGHVNTPSKQQYIDLWRHTDHQLLSKTRQFAAASSDGSLSRTWHFGGNIKSLKESPKDIDSSATFRQKFPLNLEYSLCHLDPSENLHNPLSGMIWSSDTLVTWPGIAFPLKYRSRTLEDDSDVLHPFQDPRDKIPVTTVRNFKLLLQV